MSLRDYTRKRRFDQTPEPAAAAPAASHRRPIFVVQLHHASSRHYDFRLEADGVLKSWAVPKGPSLRVGEKRLAVQVEDHPVSYATFAGDIPEGHYGAGHVDVFDHGTWTCTGDPLQALAAGKLDFVLHGERLNGGWKLVRTALRGKQPQWLLIKRDDAHAADREADDLVDATPSVARAVPSTAAPAHRDRRRAAARVCGDQSSQGNQGNQSSQGSEGSQSSQESNQSSQGSQGSEGSEGSQAGQGHQGDQDCQDCHDPP
ncbi:DNA ligase, partial [Xanthomonas sp. Kuri4-1]